MCIRRPCCEEETSNHERLYSNYTSISEEFHYNCHSSMLKGYLQMLVIAELSTGRKVVGVARNGQEHGSTHPTVNKRLHSSCCSHFTTNN